MSHSPSGIVDSLEIQMQELGQDNEEQQSGLIARNGTSFVVVDGNYDNTKGSQSPLFVSEGSPVSPPSINYELLHPEIVARDGIQVILPPVQRRWEYMPFDEEPVNIRVVEEDDDSERSQVLPMAPNGNEEKVS